MRKLIPFLVIYVLVHSGGQDSVRSYIGQDATTIQQLLKNENKTGEFITQREYEAFLEAHKPIPPAPDPDRDLAKVILLDKTKTATERIEAIIKYLALDQ